MAWTNLIGGVAVFVLAVYLWRQAGSQARDEAAVVGAGERYVRTRTVLLKFGAVFLGGVAVALFAGGFL